MQNQTPGADSADLAKAGLAIGALFMSLFGGVWLAVGLYALYPSVMSLALVGVGTSILMAASIRVYRRNAGTLRTPTSTADSRRRFRLFQWINAAQWIAIGLVAWVLSAADLSRWILPAIVGIIGLHFFPLGRLFAYRPHYWSGGALLLLALAYPVISPGGSDNGVCAVGVGLILWASSIRGLVGRTLRA
jgi:hypothetical protein